MMTKRKLTLVLMVMFVATTGHVALARAQRDDDDSAGDDVRKKIREKIHAARDAAVIQELDLDEKAAQKLFPVIDKYDAQIDPLQEENGKLRRELKQMIDSEKVDDAKVNTMVDTLLANREKMQQLELARIKDIRKVLTPAQVAHLVIVLPKIDREIGNRIRQAVRGGRRGRRGGGANAAGAGGEEDDEP
jgi:Spy/CpxP family protein refolding chaperone